MDIRKIYGDDLDLPTAPAAHVALVDALEDFLRVHEMIGRDLLAEGHIDKATFDKPWPFGEKLQAILMELKRCGPDRSLNGFLHYRPNGKFHRPLPK